MENNYPLRQDQDIALIKETKDNEKTLSLIQIREGKMNIQSEKIRLIEWLAGLTDITTLEKLSKVRQESLKDAYEANLKPMTPEELKERALKSNQDIAEGKVYDIESILKP